MTFHGGEGNHAANDSHNYFYVGFKINKSRYGFGKLLYRKHDNGLPMGLEENNGVIQADPQNLISEPQDKYAFPEKYVGVFIGDKFHGEGIKEFHSNGNLSFAGSKNIGVKQGNCQSYWTNGTLISDKFFNAKGREEGPGIKLWENGNVMSVYTFKNGLEEGPGQEFWDDGTTKSDHFMAAGLMQGLATEYHSNGSLLRKCYYINDKIHGENVKSYWSHGGLKDIVNFEHGAPKGHCRVYSINGKLAYEGEVIKKKFWFYPRSHKENFVKVFRNDGTVYVGETLGVSISHDAYRQQLPAQNGEEFIDQEEPL